MSGGEPSSIKRNLTCAARMPARSLKPEEQTYCEDQRPVCGLALRRFAFERRGGKNEGKAG